MAFLIGIDEAGYGPNFGPLVISATAWEVQGDPCRANLYKRLGKAVSDGPDGARLAIADSKLLYNPQRGLGLLERGVLSILALLGCRLGDWCDVWDRLRADGDGHRHHLPWYAGYRRPLPLVPAEEPLPDATEPLRRVCQARRVRLAVVESRAVFPQRFNALVAQHGTKGEALSRLTLDLLADVMAGLPADQQVLVVCDKHGGRNRYGALLQQRFPDTLVEVRKESRPVSIYRWGPQDCRVEVRFCAGGESFMPAALASMTSKYLRELAMQALNDFWCRELPTLRRTAGYPTDSYRFKRDIADCQRNLKIDDGILWRVR
ncbi:MAG: hypothetical protein WDZ59_10860 [Pirellulales bacterium]